MLIKTSLATAAIVLAACSSPKDIGDAVGNDQAQATGEGSETAQQTLERRLAGGAESRAVRVQNDQMNFEYTWPAQTAAIAPLDAALEARAKAEQTAFEAMTSEGKSDAEKYSYPFRPYDFAKGWGVAADTPGFLSLAASTYTYTGGAHGNSVFDAMIWDRKAEEEMAQTDLFVSSEDLETAVRENYCTGLRAEQSERLGRNIADEADMFDGCPALSELVVVLGSSNGQTFDKIDLLAAPYVAGSYVEGPYTVTVPVTQAVLGAVKPEYRQAFSIQN